MAKRLTLTERIKALITEAAGDEIDFSQIAAYESVAASTRPINQPHTAYHGAIMTEGFLSQMATAYKEESVPIQVMHNGQMLPVGKVFAAETFSADEGHTDLNVLFYVDANSQYARDIDLAILDEVSIGAASTHAYCSECSFDYMEEGNEMSFWYRECDNGHQIGKDGVHLRLTELRAWKELSLVNKGASNKPKILGSAKQRLGKDAYNQLAASHSNPEAVQFSYLACSPTQSETTGETMDLSALSNQVSTLSAANGKLELKLETAESALEASQTEVAKLKGQIETLEAQVEAGSDSKLKTELTEAKTSLEAAKKIVGCFDEQLKVAAVAAGLEFSEDATADEKIELLKKAQIKLAAIPRGGVSQGAGAPEDDNIRVVSAAHNSAFVSNR
tara:strand:+ start:7648 stop:8817 length:1170 start_codon:yes stop_codon:yes gene_type:complete